MATGSGITYNGTTFSTTNDASINGLTVGKGAGSVSSNTAVGASALAANTSGNNNTALGNQAGQLNTTGSCNVMVGSVAGYNASGGASVGVGYQALRNDSGGNNVGVGYYALITNTSGSANTAIGRESLQANTTASNNTAVGYQAGYTNVTGQYCTFIGQSAGYASTGDGNCFVGRRAGVASTGTNNTFIGGINSGSDMTTGSKNTIVGVYSGNQGGLDIRTASNNIVLSDGDGNPRQVVFNSGNVGIGLVSDGSLQSSGVWIAPSYDAGSASGIAIGHANGSVSSNTYMGFVYNSTKIGSITQNGTTGVLYNLTSDYRLKNDQQPLTGAKEFVMALQPKKWQWWDGSGEGVGFVAHEFMEVAKYSGHGEKDAVDADGKPVYQSIQPSSSEVMANLVSFIQEQQAIIESLKARLDAANL